MPDPNKTREHNRIIYIDPNNIYGRINGVPVTPDYTDLCISLDFEVETYSRLNRGTQAIVDNNSTATKQSKYHIMFQSRGGENDVIWANFLGAEEANNGKSYLTTYYTDINYSDYQAKDIIEGLGIANVSISFESYYTPTIKIKFIDVRGASLFGRDESVHEHESIKSDTIWGCFFTYPYPKFRLQIKGFYGQAVTFQLTCLDFRGSLNANTGNFEIDTTFIGYDYGLLADIPMAYLVAAPYCGYIGRSYWDKHKSSEEWKMSDGNEPITLYELKQRITQAVTPPSDENNTAASSNTNDYTEELEYLESMSKQIEDGLKPLYKNMWSDGSADGALYLDNNTMASSTPGSRWDIIEKGDTQTKLTRFKNGLKKLKEIYTEYREKYSDTKDNILIDINDNEFPTLEEGSWKRGTTKSDEGKTVDWICKYKVHWHDFDKFVENRFETIKGKAALEERKLEEQEEISASDDNIYELVGLLPYVGNMFKVVMCHLETFMAIMYGADEEISQQKLQGNRMMSKLGIKNFEMTDIATNDGSEEMDLPPWPGIYLETKTTTDGEDGEIVDEESTHAWPGALVSTNEWVEMKVVNALAVAARMSDTLQEDDGESVNTPILAYPILPSDFYNGAVAPLAYHSIDNNGAENIAAWLSLRAASIFGVGNCASKYAEFVGKLDAMNLYKEIGSQSVLKQILVDTSGSNSISDNLYKIALLTDNSNRKSFEYSNQRQPMFKKNKGILEYTYTKSGTGYDTIPVELKESWASTLTSTYTPSGNQNGTVYNIGVNDKLTNTNFIYSCSSDDLLNNSGYSGKIDGFTNQYMYDIVTDESRINETRTSKKNLETSPAYNDTDLSTAKKYVETYWFDSDDEFKKYYTFSDNSKYVYLSDGYKVVFPEDMQEKYEQYLLQSDDGDEYTSDYNKGAAYARKAVINESNDVTVSSYITNSETVDDKYVLCPGLAIGNTGKRINVFSTGWYYAQNAKRSDIIDANTHPNDVQSMYMGLKIGECCKALLFLVSQYYNKVQALTNASESMSIEAIPYGYALLLGALLWRDKYNSEHKYDAIIYCDNIEFMSKTGLPIINGVGGYMNRSDSGLVYATLKTYQPKLAEADIQIKNAYIDLFLNFIKGDDWKVIKEGCELHPSMNCKEFNDKVKTINESTYILEAISKAFPTAKGKYAYFYQDKSTNDYIESYLSEKNPAQDALRKLYSKKCIILSLNNGDTSKHSHNITINDDTFRKYLTGFESMVKKIVNGEVPTSITVENNDGEMVDEKTNDVRCAMYIWLKSVWDKWLCGNKLSNFTVGEYFYNHFIFIDNQYKNIRNRLRMNCEKIRDLIEDVNGETTIFKFLSVLTTDNNCMFFALPNFISFTGNDEEDVQTMENLFKPVPFIRKEAKQAENKFIIMYTHTPSQIMSEQNNYKYDSFDIYDVKNGVVPHTFDQMSIQNEDLKKDKIKLADARYGYNLPAFGVPFGSMNNHIFKDIKVGMQNPIQTEQSINAFSLVAERGNGGDKRVVFYGQDLYPIYTGYSYTCELEMMGNAQIMPLMYFQLMNTPMFRGAYMIYGVTHTITPGMMTTHVKAMKMSKHSLPYPKQWFGTMIGSYFGEDHDRYECDEGESTGGYVGERTEFKTVNLSTDIAQINPQTLGRKINEIILHCAATPEGQKISAKTIWNWHVRDNGWRDIGYNYVIYLDGTVVEGRPLSISGAHTVDHNSHSIGICYVGGVDKNNKPKDTRTDAQLRAMKDLLVRLMVKFNLNASQVHGHNEFAAKACPSFDVQPRKGSVGWVNEINLDKLVKDFKAKQV